MIAYFSWSGHSQAIAEQIQRQVGGDLARIEPVKKYSSNYEICVDEAKNDQANQARPELKTKIENMAQYKVIFLGFPNWWSGVPAPIATFLEQYDFQGKIISPFVSHGGGGLGRIVSELARLAPYSTIKEALSISSDGGASLSRNIDAWLKKIGLEKN
jgi:flavodoxin